MDQEILKKFEELASSANKQDARIDEIYKSTEKTRKYISKVNTGRKMTKEQIERGVIARVGQNTSLGCKRTTEMKKHLSDLKKKKVIYNSIVYDSLMEVSIDTNIKYQTLYAMLSNRNTNRLNLQYHA